MSKWVTDPNGTCKDHWIDLMYDPDKLDDGSFYCWKYASVKWDGCIHFHTAGNVPFDKDYGMPNTKRDESARDDYIHICDLDEYIKELQELKIKAMDHFKGREAWENKQPPKETE